MKTSYLVLPYCTFKIPSSVNPPCPSPYVHCQRRGAVSGWQRIRWKGLTRRRERGRGSQRIRREQAKHSSNVRVPIASSAQVVLLWKLSHCTEALNQQDMTSTVRIHTTIFPPMHKGLRDKKTGGQVHQARLKSVSLCSAPSVLASL